LLEFKVVTADVIGNGKGVDLYILRELKGRL
jgi:hypothetical protein